MRRSWFYAIYLFILAALCVAGAEVILRAKGVRPWRPDAIAIRVEPGGRFFQKHPILGYSHIPGRFTVTLPSGYTFRVTHLPNTLRITRPLDTYGPPSQGEQIWIFGGSFTHGWTVNDEETYPWLLQRRLPQFDVVNFGVSGYGTIHSLHQFRDALKTATPKVAVLAYASFHDERNTFGRTRRKAVAPWNRLGPLVQPYARLNKQGGLEYFIADVEYKEFPMMRYSALSHFLEMAYDSLERRWLRSRTVSEALVLEMATLAKAHEVKFVVANIGGTEMESFLTANGITSTDISVDFNIAENTNLPHDDHPSALAHVRYAEKLERFLRAEGLTSD